MGNSNTDHSRKLRQQTANARRAAIIAAGGKQLNTLLQSETARKLMFLREWHGTAHGAATETAVIKRLIDDAVFKLEGSVELNDNKETLTNAAP